ncbi:FAD-dependent oxidoreductase [Cetobacterium sp. 8H]|uniref:NAD(P)/FAD-dependent oxidoreductase n=1 Tax=Cetobacterium sp. 8H TaxID=2759681 RepID=UPI00163BA2D0|nr:NAD(P)/FAD-dependent oxidoreductase [Cetobacterium sp. 8H]MBC2852137.1 FAD-dependent oxidoreductase [Cetobacterium sp. 8H]
MIKKSNNFCDVIIVGGGPAGASAAVYVASRGLKSIIFEKNDIGGTAGKVSSITHYLSVDNFETGESFKNKLEEQLKKYEIEIVKEEIVEFNLNKKTVITKSGSIYESSAIILANGTTPRKLNISGEDEFTGKGISSNPSKDGKNYIGKDIFVIGGADGAIKEAIYLSKYAKKLSIIHFEENLGTIAEFKNKLSTLNNIDLFLHSRLTKVEGKECIEFLEITDEKTKEVTRIESKGAGVFVYVGATPNTDKYSELDLENGFIKVNNKMQTNIEGIYAAGDICSKDIRQIATAVADGTIAGINVSNYLKNK